SPKRSELRREERGIWALPLVYGGRSGRPPPPPPRPPYRLDSRYCTGGSKDSGEPKSPTANARPQPSAASAASATSSCRRGFIYGGWLLKFTMPVREKKKKKGRRGERRELFAKKKPYRGTGVWSCAPTE